MSQKIFRWKLRSLGVGPGGRTYFNAATTWVMWNIKINGAGIRMRAAHTCPLVEELEQVQDFMVLIEAPDVPRTRTGKLMEIPVKKVLQGKDPAGVDREAALDPDILQWYLDFVPTVLPRLAEPTLIL